MNSPPKDTNTAAPPPQQPPAMGVPLHQHEKGTQDGTWSTGLFGCFDDIPSCLLTCWCPCITFGQISEIVDQGATSCLAYGALYAVTGCMFSCVYRAKMRKSFMLEESPCNDCCVHWFCNRCALCQEYRELKNRGFDMTIGWEGNMQRQNKGGVAMASSAPVVEGGMVR